MSIKANLLRSITDWRDGWPIDGAPLAETLERFAVPELIAEFRKAQAVMPPLELGRTWPTWTNSPGLPPRSGPPREDGSPGEEISGEEVPAPEQRIRNAMYAFIAPVIDAWNAGALRATGKRNCDAFAVATEIPAPANLWPVKLIDVEHSIINDPSGGAILDLRFYAAETSWISPVPSKQWLMIMVEELKDSSDNLQKGPTAIAKMLYPKMADDYQKGKVVNALSVETLVKRLRDYKLWP